MNKCFKDNLCENLCHIRIYYPWTYFYLIVCSLIYDVAEKLIDSALAQDYNRKLEQVTVNNIGTNFWHSVHLGIKNV